MKDIFFSSDIRLLIQFNFSGIDFELLRNDSEKFNWTPLLSTSSIDGMIKILNNILITLYDVHAPVQPIKMRHIPSLCLTDEIKKNYVQKQRQNLNLKQDLHFTTKNNRYMHNINIFITSYKTVIQLKSGSFFGH